MKKRNLFLILGCVAGASLLLETGCAHRRVVYVHDAPATVVVNEMPPPQEEMVGVAPGAGYVWVPGAWEWQGQWVWRSGQWTMSPHPHAHWMPSHWERHGRARVWVGGHWR